MTSRIFMLAICLVFSTAVQAATPEHDRQITLTDEDYALAVKFNPVDLASLVRNAQVRPNWMQEENRFWYSSDTDNGPVIILVDAATGARSPAYDLARMATALGAVTGADATGATARPTALTTVEGRLEVEFDIGQQVIQCVAETYICRVVDTLRPSPDMLFSPDGTKAAFVRDHNLWVRNIANGDETRLTTDGSQYRAYASPTDRSQLDPVRGIDGRPAPPVDTHWSPDGRWLITRQIDETEVAVYPFFEPVPADGSFRPKVHELRIPLLGDVNLRKIDDYVIDVETGTKTTLKLPAGFDLESFVYSNQPFDWSDDSTTAVLYASSVDAQLGRLLEVDMKTGDTRTILEEKAPGSRVFLSSSFRVPAAVHVSDEEVIWYSERSGWGHLYLYDRSSGEVIRQLTEGDWAVYSLIHVDMDQRSLLIVGMGREEGTDPYHRYIYRVSLDGGEPVLLTPEPANHLVASESVSPDGDYFVDNYSTVSMPPNSVLRSVWEPERQFTLEQADASALYALGWKAPERLRVKAADGKTDLYAVVFQADDRFHRYGKLPVVENNYLNSIAATAPRDFMNAVGRAHMAALAQLGFHTIIVDGRGTPERSRAFREAGYPEYRDLQVEDHVTALHQIGALYPDMDMDRIGVYGHSNGGAGAARLILRRPDIYKVAVASAGSHDLASLPGSGIKFRGLPRYADGSSLRPSPSAVPENVRAADNAALAGNLNGELMLAYGNLDTAALPTATLRLVDALIKADKRFDLIYMPNRGHRFYDDPYFGRRLRLYFVEHLHGIRPPI